MNQTFLLYDFQAGLQFGKNLAKAVTNTIGVSQKGSDRDTDILNIDQQSILHNNGACGKIL